MRLLISFAALFLSVIFLQLSSGVVGPLDAISGSTLGFATEQIGLLGSAHFLGFFIGCWWAPRLIGGIGHSRAFATFTALGAIGLIAHMIIVDPYAWALMRIGSGMCIAGAYTVVEAWLQAKLTNENRGRAMGTYRVVDMGASLAAQVMVGVLEPASYVSYNLLAIICCAAILPLTLSRASPPETPLAPRLRPMIAIALSPLGATAVVVAGLTSAAFRMVGPVYGQEIGLSLAEIGYFLAAFVAGGAAAQYPVGWLADKYDRRTLMIWLSAAAVASCAVTVLLGATSPQAAIASAALFGFTTFPIFSIASAHANDFATSEQRVELSAALMFLFAVGAIGSPLGASYVIDAFGPSALFLMIAVAHLLLVAVGLLRNLVGRVSETRTRYVYAPRTSFLIGRLLSRQREVADDPKKP